MAANAWAVYGAAVEGIHKGTIDLDTDTFRMILTTAHTPNQSTHSTWADVSANEVSGTGYTSSGKLLSATVNRTGLVVTFDVDDQSWTTSTLASVDYAVIVRDADANGTLASTDLLLCYSELENGGSLSTTAGTLSVTINASGVFTTTAATAA